MTTTQNAAVSEPTPTPIHDAYVKRLRARLARPQVTTEEARDGVLDCFVSTYFEGLKVGLKGVVGIEAGPDEVARLAASLFRRRLKAHGASFEQPTVASLATVKEEVDAEFHFSELPAELRATHDQVCSLLLAKADGALAHHGDRSVVARAPAPTSEAAPVARPPPPPAEPRVTPGGTQVFASGTAPAVATPARASTPAPRTPVPVDGVSQNLRAALASYLQGFASAALAGESTAELQQRLARVQKLLGAVAEFEQG
jgi:hypothetical protein